MPTGIVFAIARDRGFFSAHFEIADLFYSLAHFRFVPHNSNQVLHRFLQIFLDSIRVFTIAALKWSERLARDDVDFLPVDRAVLTFTGELRCEFAGAFSKHQKVRQRIAA